MRALMACLVVVWLTVVNPSAQEPDWHVDLTASSLVEGWDRNESREYLAGIFVGLDRRVWRGLSVRGEGLVFRVTQRGNDALVGGITLGARTRWHAGGTRPFVDIGGGASQATEPVPLRGTEFNFLLLAGGGFEIPLERVSAIFGGRWFHISNNGREGRGFNPDIQSVGFFVGIGWM